MSSRRPSGLTMEGMIWNANHVLEQALNPGVNGLPRAMFEKCKALVLISVVEVGFIFTGNVGSGIIMAKKESGWSLPSACGLTGVGWGFVVGGSIKDVIIFVMDDRSLKGLLSEAGVQLGGQAEITLGAGRSFQVALDGGDRGGAGTYSFAFAKGAFLGVSVEGGVVGSRDDTNKNFYGLKEGKKLSATQIVLQDMAHMPSNKVTLLAQVYDKLGKLAQGDTAKPTSAEEEQKRAAFEAAEKSAELASTEGGVVHVDAAAEAQKEASA